MLISLSFVRVHLRTVASQLLTTQSVPGYVHARNSYTHIHTQFDRISDEKIKRLTNTSISK